MGLSAITGRADPEKEKAKEAKKVAAQYGYEKPEDSPFYHPTLNPHGVPPSGHERDPAGGAASDTGTSIELVGLKDLTPAPVKASAPLSWTTFCLAYS